MAELARCPSVERSGSDHCRPEPESFRVNDLVVELELNPVLTATDKYDEDTVEAAWEGMLREIRWYLGRSTSVVIRGWTQALSMKFSKRSIAHHFGSLGNRCQWVDGVQFAASREAEEERPFHQVTTMERFVDLIKDTNTCGNFLDGKDTNPCPPTWMTPLLDSTTAWNQTLHLSGRPTAGKRKERSGVTIEAQGPSVIRCGTWTSPGWRLLTHPGFVTFPHHDCCGWCTYVIGNSGAKIWGVMRPKRPICPSSLPELREVFRRAMAQSQEGSFPDAAVATVCLEAGDIM